MTKTLTVRFQVRSHNSSCGIYGGQGGKFGSVGLEKDGTVLLDRSCEKRRSVTKIQGGEGYPTYNKNEEG